MKRKTYQIKKNDGNFILNITSMTDMFTLLLVFLLQSFAASSIEVKNHDDLKLSYSHSDTAPIVSPMISISRHGIYLKDDKVIALEDGTLSSETLKNGSLQILTEKIKTSTDKNSLKDMTLLVDETIPYATTKHILTALENLGLEEVKFVNYAGE